MCIKFHGLVLVSVNICIYTIFVITYMIYTRFLRWILTIPSFCIECLDKYINEIKNVWCTPKVTNSIYQERYTCCTLSTRTNEDRLREWSWQKSWSWIAELKLKLNTSYKISRIVELYRIANIWTIESYHVMLLCHNPVLLHPVSYHIKLS